MSKKKVTKPVEEEVIVPEVQVEEALVEEVVPSEIVLQGPLAEVYKMFVSELSSSEQEVYLNNPGKAIFAFKKFLNDMAPEEMAKLVEYSVEQ